MDWWLTSTKGSGTATIVGGEIRLHIPDSADDDIKADYKWQIPAGDFIFKLDLTEYLPDDSDYGPNLRIDVRDSFLVTNDYFTLHFRTDSTSPIYRSRIWNVIGGGAPTYGTILRTSTRPTKLKLERSGNTMKGYVYEGGSWKSLGTQDMGTDAADLIYIRLFMNDVSSNGGQADLDNLIFDDGCPDGTKAWTTTTTTTSSSTTTTTSPP